VEVKKQAIALVSAKAFATIATKKLPQKLALNRSRNDILKGKMQLDQSHIISIKII